MLQGGLYQVPVGVGGDVHPHALHFQQGQEFFHAGLGLDFVFIESTDLGLGQLHDLLHRFGQVVFLFAKGGAVPEGHQHQPVPQVRGGFDTHGAEQVGRQAVPDVHGVQQGAVHVKNRTL